MLITIKGLIGSGKTTTSEYLHRKYGVYHYNCDARVKSIYANHKEVINLVNSRVLKTDGDSIDMEKLKSVAFSNPDILLELEDILYPYIEAEIDAVSEEWDIVLVDGQQVDKLDLDVDCTICLKIDDDVLIERVISRDGRTRKQILEILNIQNEYELTADFIIENNGTIEQLYTKLDELMEELNAKASR